jgi:hypothetical protein
MAFLIDEPRLHRLVENIQKELKALDLETDLLYQVSFSEADIEYFTSVEEVLKIQNSGDRKITGIWITTLPNSTTQVAARFSTVAEKFAKSGWTPVEYQISGPTSHLARLSEQTSKYLREVTQWYSRYIFTPRAYLVYFLMIFVVLFVVGGIFDLIAPVIGPLIPKGASVVLLQAIFGVVGAVLGAGVGVGLVWLLNKLIDMIFPVGIFAIGEGQSRHEKRRNLSVLGLIGTLVTIVTGLLTLGNAIF